MTTIIRYRATFRDGTVTRSIWTDRPLTHGWRWMGTDGYGQSVGDSGFSGSEELAQKQIKSGTSRLFKKPRRSKYEIDEEWKPGGFVTTEEIVPTEIVEVSAVKHPPPNQFRSVSPNEILESWHIDEDLRTALQRLKAATSIAAIWDGLSEQEQRAFRKAAAERQTLDMTGLLDLGFSKKT